jgi:hypothetical protein
VFFIRLLLTVDDYGLFSADPEFLKGHLYPAGCVRTLDVRRALKECVEVGVVKLYEEKQYLQVQKFGQALDRGLVAKWPLPPWEIDLEASVPKRDYEIVYEIFKSDWKIAQLCNRDQVFLFRLLLVVDRYGYYHAEPGSLHAALHPLKGSIRLTDRSCPLTNCEMAEVVRCEKFGGREFVRVLGYRGITRDASRSKFLRQSDSDPPDVNNSEARNRTEANGKETPISSPRGADSSISSSQVGRRERANARSLHTFMKRRDEIKKEMEEILNPFGHPYPPALEGAKKLNYDLKRSLLKRVEADMVKLGDDSS